MTVEWQKQREQGAEAARYLRVDLLVDGALCLLLLLHSQQIHQGPDGHALGRGRGHTSARGTGLRVGWAQQSQAAGGGTVQRFGDMGQ